jgi:flagellar hook-associated protein 1
VHPITKDFGVSTLFSTLNIARSGLATSQAQLDTTGHNIANVNKEGFSRQRVELVGRVPVNKIYGQIGTGVAISGVERIRDEFLDGLFQNQVAGLGNAEIRAEFYELIEGVFLEPTDNGLSNRINSFFSSLNDFAGNVESIPVRTSILADAQRLAQSLNDTADRIKTLRTNANEEVKNFVPDINSLTDRIAKLNQQIANSELGGTTANDLRDDRGVLLDKLAKIVNIFTRERSDGQVDVLVSGEVLVDGSQAQILEAVPNAALDPERNDLVEVRFARNGKLLNVQNGELYGALELRDSILAAVDDEIDTLAATFIEQINRTHTQGAGLVGYTGTVLGSNSVTDPTLALNTAGLPFSVSQGSFDIHIFDESTDPPTAVGGTPVTINILATTSLNDIVAQLNAVPNITATVGANKELSITAAPGFSFTNSGDDSNVLGALGVNTFFTGSDARTIGLNNLIRNNVELLSSRYSPNPLDSGDNTLALALVNVQNGTFLNGNTSTINNFYESTVVQVGVDTRANLQTLEVERTFVENFERRRQEVSGVSLDEEVTLLIQFQRAFEASARVVTVTDRMLESLLNMAR